MRPSPWQGIQRLLVVRLDNIGDMVMLTPALRGLRQALPGVHITLMASPAGSQLAPLLPWVDDVLVHRAVWQDARGNMPLDPAGQQALVEELRVRRFDAAAIFTSFSQSPYPPAYVCYLAGVPVRVGQSHEFGGSVLSHWVRPLPHKVHQVDRNLHLLEATGLPLAERHMELRIPEDVQARADGLLRAGGIDLHRPFVLLTPGASCAARRYDIARFAAVARLLWEATGLPMALTGSSREAGLLQPLMQATRGLPVASLVGQTSVPELAAVVRRARLVVCAHSAPMHLADALRRPVVVLFSGTDLESQWMPRNTPARVLRRPTDCSPCYGFQCPYMMECLDIPPGEVVQNAVALLEETLTLDQDGATTVQEGAPR